MKNALFQRSSIPFADDPKSFQRLAITVQGIVLAATIVIIFLVSNDQTTVIALAILVAITLLLSAIGVLWPAQFLTPSAVAIVSTIFMLEGSGIHDIGLIGLISSILVGGLLLGGRGLTIFGVLAIAVFLGIGIAEISGYYSPPTPAITIAEELFIAPLLLIAIIVNLNVLINRLRNIARQATENEQAQVTANKELLQLKESLETRITERTADLERRAMQMEAIASVTRSITTAQDLEQLLPAICQVVSERFGFYHTGIFLIDERGDYAVLQAANSPGGKKMLERGHRLRVGATGIVGTVAGQGEARIALDVGVDAVFFNNPDLPETRSEMALPLKIGGQTVGVLDVQSREVGAFKEEDVSVLSILANQVSIAIENARLFSQTRQALSESQTIYQQYVKSDWARFVRTLKHSGFTYDGLKSVPLNEDAVPSSPDALDIPIKIRGLTVGNVTVRSRNPLRTWSQDDINLAQAAAERAGLAIENFRLLTEAQRRAAKERTIGEITSRVSSSVNMHAIMQTAVEELGRVLPGAQITLQLKNQEEN